MPTLVPPPPPPSSVGGGVQQDTSHWDSRNKCPEEMEDCGEGGREMTSKRVGGKLIPQLHKHCKMPGIYTSEVVKCIAYRERHLEQAKSNPTRF